jgi:hypothetical protein
MKFFDKHEQNYGGYMGFDLIRDRKLGQLPVEQVYQLSLILNNGDKKP